MMTELALAVVGLAATGAELAAKIYKFCQEFKDWAPLSSSWQVFYHNLRLLWSNFKADEELNSKED